MARVSPLALVAAVLIALGGGDVFAQLPASAPPEQQAVKAVLDELTKAFNAGNVEDAVALFLPNGELVDEDLVVHGGKENLTALLTAFFERYPGAKMVVEVESARAVRPDLTIAEICRTTSLADGTQRARIRSNLTLAKEGDRWQIASIRDEPADDEWTPRQRLEPLSWMIGQWIDESPEALVQLDCRWAPGEAYLIVDFKVVRSGKVALQSQQRIGWDPVAQRIHSWTFDSDGGYGEADWTQNEGYWLVKSSAVMPDGATGSSTFEIDPGKDRFTMRGFDRVLGETVLPDVEVTVVRHPATVSQAAR